MDYAIQLGLLLLNASVENAPNLVGFLMPFVVEAFNKNVKTPQARRFVSFAICCIVAVLLKWKSVLYGSPEQAFISMALIFAESQLIFKLWFNDSFARRGIQNVVGHTWVQKAQVVEEREEPIQ